MHRFRRPALAGTMAALLGFAVLSLLVTWGATEAFDRRLVAALRSPGAPGDPLGPDLLGEFFFDVTHAGGRSIVGVFGLLVAGLLAVLARWRDLAFLTAALLGGAGLSDAFKALFARVRPELVPHLAEETSSSFPSGHATYAAIAYITFAILLAPALPSRARAYIAGAATLVVLLVGFSRVWLGVHYPSDVLAGWCLGAGWALGCWLVIDRLAPNR